MRLRLVLVFAMVGAFASQALAALAPQACYVNQAALSGTSTVVTTVGTNPQATLLDTGVNLFCTSLGEVPGQPAILPPREGDRLNVISQCMGRSGVYAITATRSAEFKMSHTTWDPLTNWSGHFIPVHQETVNVFASPQLAGAYVSFDAPVEQAGSPFLLNLTMHGVPGKTIYWACSYGYTYFQPPQPPVDQATGFPFP